MNWLDIVLCILLLIGAWKGYVNGLFIEVATIIALVAAIYGSIYFSNYAGDWLTENVNWDAKYITIASFVITFIAIILVITYVGKILTKIIKTVQLSFINKIAGAIFGLLKLGFIASVALMFINTASGEFDILPEEALEGSLLYPHLEPVAPAVLPTLIEEAGKIDKEIRNLDEEDQEN
jgi:membrane protein required for colicin V production